ncbi:hypothetical protein [Solitalea lacus]|uniref:hypothetical protein n=1 Tax=Solitalea lacus TaxID=2911172 RepID=UPI001EDB31EE|nr:hypothetical protein [Solitalea lacus]UKJ08333.1 hypothetical protein L2B55_03975 [Solitalea lacus]
MRERISFIESHENGIIGKRVILVKIIWAVLLILSISFLSAAIIENEHSLRYSLLLILIWTQSIGFLYLVQKGENVRLIAILYITLLLFLIFGFSLFGGGMKSHGIRILPIVVLFAGLTMGKKELWVFGVAAILIGLILVVVDSYNFLPVKEPIGLSSLTYWIHTSTSIILLCFLENLSVEKLRGALTKTQEELMLRKQSEEALKLKNEKLTEIAHIQSHMVRAPVANILGLINLIKSNNEDGTLDTEVLTNLKAAAEDLDSIIHQIVQKACEVDHMAENETE